MKKIGGILLLIALLFTGCAPSVTTTVAGKESKKIDFENYKGPRARVVVASFECTSPQCGSGASVPTGTVQILNLFGINIPTATTGIGSDVSTMLSTALVSSNHFVVYDRSIINQLRSEAALSNQQNAFTGADLIITGVITGFEPNASGSGGVGAIPFIGGFLQQKKSYIRVDIRIVDTRSGAIIAAFPVEAEATDTNFGGIGAGLLPGGLSALAGGLRIYNNTPMAKALAMMIEAATVAIIERIPQSYMKYDPTGKPIQ
ncbi:curli assembly protein CsgG [Meiothermus sp. QL-1]|uniref:CsgG/HfaB family protein n=1 Tax=Meiothermus sp. QL-1 TaxID=2058095 RepID=UPI000E0B6D60|nr:CsgG/HfaB family protein [Meiothermus sp. QL-1]RDI94491.1 curli assembly protein CsgG [Meiothermus sp. QL-1]